MSCRPAHNFNSRPSARGDLAAWRVWMNYYPTFQFTPLREGRQAEADFFRVSVWISIHAPPRGATGIGNDYVALGAISIHAPPRGATRREMRKPHRGGISIHAPPRGATFFHECFHFLAVISIHAPPRGATRQRYTAANAESISIHAPPRGATSPKRNPPPISRFQFTPLREGRLPVPAAEETVNYFNSRPSARGDCTVCTHLIPHFAFQFTPLREGRRQKICNFCKSFVQPLQISMA